MATPNIPVTLATPIACWLYTAGGLGDAAGFPPIIDQAMGWIGAGAVCLIVVADVVLPVVNPLLSRFASK